MALQRKDFAKVYSLIWSYKIACGIWWDIFVVYARNTFSHDRTLITSLVCHLGTQLDFPWETLDDAYWKFMSMHEISLTDLPSSELQYDFFIFFPLPLTPIFISSIQRGKYLNKNMQIYVYLSDQRILKKNYILSSKYM